MRPLSTLIVALMLLTAPPEAGAGASSGCSHPRVPLEMLRETVAGISDYNTAAITNQTRFIAELLFSLADNPGLAAVETFQIDPSTFIEAWLQATGRAQDDVPDSMAAVLEYGQRFVVSIVAEPQAMIRRGPPARRMLNVRIEWPDDPRTPGSYSLEDRLSDPDVQLHHRRVITYSLIDFGEFFAFESIHGIAGRPTSGALGALFSLVGTGDIRSTRFATAEDGIQINRSHIRKWMGFNAVATIQPDGTAERGTPPGRDDLAALEQLLDTDLDIRTPEVSPRPCF